LARLSPGGALLFAVTALLQVPALRESLSTLVPVYPYALFGVGIFIAWRFNRSRIVLALLVLGLADRALIYLVAGDAPATGGARIVFSAVGLLLPVNLAALSWTPERGLGTRQGRLSVAFLLVQLLLAAMICLPGFAPVAALLEHPFVEVTSVRRIALPQPALVAFGLAFAFVVARFLRRPNPIEAGSVWALVASFLAMAAGQVGVVSTVYLTAAGLILLVSLVETWHAMAYSDALTGLPGRRALHEALRDLDDRYAIAMVDIDHFKRINDDLGHDVGDQVLRMVASRLASVGGGGKPFRYGGEEFAVIFAGRSVDEARPHLEALRRRIEASPFVVRGRFRPREKPKPPRPSAGRKQVAVTVSIGVAEAGRRNPTPRRVIDAADAHLYRAKRAGRNRVSP
jgi:diguanylate cyclase (GGDEF)-like protein